MSWTDDRVNLLRRLWSEGRSAAEIAKELGGITRNAVIGKAHRLKLSHRVSPIQQNNKKPAAKPSERKPDKTVIELTPVKVVEARLPNRDTSSLLSLLDLKPRMCRWPVGDPHDDEFGFCGEEVIMGLPYCCEHAKAAYQAATRNKIIQAESALTSVDARAEPARVREGKAQKASA